jgi:hypothetical protein
LQHIWEALAKVERMMATERDKNSDQKVILIYPLFAPAICYFKKDGIFYHYCPTNPAWMTSVAVVSCNLKVDKQIYKCNQTS